jgi:hypothetical protein
MTITDWLPEWAPDPWMYGAAAGPLLLMAAVFWLGRWTARRGRRRAPLEPGKPKTRTSKGDLIAAAIATAVAAEGMWETFEALDMPIWLRAVTFAFIEVNVLQCARRARRTMQHKLAEIAANRTPWEKASSGIDGIAMWVLTCISAGLSVAHELTVDDPNAAVVLVRLVAPLIAAWGWERHMALERHAGGLRKAINWTVSLERVAVRLGIAEPAERSLTDVDVHRRLHRVAVAAARYEEVRAGGWRLLGARQRAAARLKGRLREAFEHTALADDPELQARLEAETAALTLAESFGGVPRRPFWMPAPPVRSGAGVERVTICAGRSGLLHVRGHAPGDAELEREAGRLRESVRRLRTLGRTGYGPGPDAADIARPASVRSGTADRAEPVQEGPVPADRTEPGPVVLEPDRTADRPVERTGMGGPDRVRRTGTVRSGSRRTGPVRRTEPTPVAKAKSGDEDALRRLDAAFEGQDPAGVSIGQVRKALDGARYERAKRLHKLWADRTADQSGPAGTRRSGTGGPGGSESAPDRTADRSEDGPADQDQDGPVRDADRELETVPA